jgi:hypothetical protein
MNTKFCNCCKKNKNKDQYPKDKSKSDGLHSNCKQCKSQQYKIWKEQNREECLRKKREYQQNHKDKENLRAKIWAKNHPERIKELKKCWQTKNQSKITQKKKELRNTSPIHALRHNMRNRIRSSLKNKSQNKDKRTIQYLGCSWDHFKLHIESQFVYGMNWDNYGFNGWHIDHIMPLSSANNQKELEKLFHYTNCQPLWAADNISKGGRIPSALYHTKRSSQ